MNRRHFITATAATTATALAGCTDGGEQCTDHTAYEELVTLDASEETTIVIDGAELTSELEDVQLLVVVKQQTHDGARPSVYIKDPNGATVYDAGPKEHIEHTISDVESGVYNVVVQNTAWFDPGAFEVTITAQAGDC